MKVSKFKLLYLLSAIAMIIYITSCARRHYECNNSEEFSIIDSLHQRKREALLYSTTTLLLSTDREGDRVQELTERVDNCETKGSDGSWKFRVTALVVSLGCIILLGGFIYIKYKQKH